MLLHPSSLSSSPSQVNTRQQASWPFSYPASPRLHSLDTVPDGLSVTVTLRSLPQCFTCQLVLLPVWYRAKSLAPFFRWLPSLLPDHPPQSLSSLACLPGAGTGGREQAPIIIPTPSQLRSPQRQSGSWSRKGYEAGKNNKHILLLLPWPSSIPTSWCRILG